MQKPQSEDKINSLKGCDKHTSEQEEIKFSESEHKNITYDNQNDNSESQNYVNTDSDQTARSKVYKNERGKVESMLESNNNPILSFHSKTNKASFKALQTEENEKQRYEELMIHTNDQTA